MILTVTLNPAVDKTCHIGELMLGQVNRLQSVKSIAGGKGVNVTKVLRQFGYPVAAMGFVGGYSGSLIEDRLEAMGATCQFTHIGGETRVSTNVLAENGYVTEILEPGPEITEDEIRQFTEEYEKQVKKAKVVVLSGSVPQGVPQDIYAELITIAVSNGCKVFLDTSGEALKEGVKAVPHMIKPNRKEMEYLVGRKLITTQDMIEEAEKLLERGIETVVISLGSKGFLHVDKEGVIEQPAYKVKTVNTVACGDCLVTSYCMGSLEGWERMEQAKCAAALSATNAATAVSAEISMDIYNELLML